MLGARSKLLTAPGPSDSLGQPPTRGGINSQFKNIWKFQSTVPVLKLSQVEHFRDTDRSVLKSEA